jgi:hypothetical protein
MAGQQDGSRARSGRKRRSSKGGPLFVLEQWVEVRVVDAQTETRLFPSNGMLAHEISKLSSEPDVVYRRFHFPDGVPAEYLWTCPDDAAQQARGGCGIQRMTYASWLTVAKKESHNEGGHLGPVGTGNLPRPKERGGCPCPVCVTNQTLIDGSQKDSEPEITLAIPEPGSACRPKPRAR